MYHEQRNVQGLPLTIPFIQRAGQATPANAFYQPQMIMTLPVSFTFLAFIYLKFQFHPGLYQNQQYLHQIPMQNFIPQMPNLPGIPQQVSKVIKC